MKSGPLRLGLLLFLVVLSVGLVFAAITQHAWEDYWITYRASRNLATGHGLVFVPGERLHTYTSPLGTLLPAFFCWITGGSDQLTLWLFRIVSLTALSSGLILLLRILQKAGVRPAICFFTVMLIGLDSKTVDFSINGMETGVMIFFLAFTLHSLLIDGPRQILRLGLAWAGLMWTRPDSFIYIGILSLGVLIFLPREQSGRIGWGKYFISAGVICAVLYLPWVIWAWNYYGNPVPNTIIAKATTHPLLPVGEIIQRFFLTPLRCFKQYAMYRSVFMPAYASFGGWSLVLEYTTAILALLLSLAWLVPGLQRRTRIFSMTFFLSLFYLDSIVRGYYAWYIPSVSTLGYLTLGMLLEDGFLLTKRSPSPGKNNTRPMIFSQTVGLVGGGLLAGQLAVLICTAREMYVQQSIIENGLRKPLGLWLHDHARSPHDTVMLEPLGYIGYYSQLKFYDYPGLSSREMIETRQRLGPDKENLAYRELKPDWIVLRPSELAKPSHMIDPTHLDELYDPVIVFDVSDKVAETQWLPGRRYLQFDQKFYVFHLKDSPTARNGN